MECFWFAERQQPEWFMISIQIRIINRHPARLTTRAALAVLQLSLSYYFYLVHGVI